MTDWPAFFVSIASVVVAVVVALTTIPHRHRTPFIFVIFGIVAIGLGVGLYGLINHGHGTDPTPSAPSAIASDFPATSAPISATKSPDSKIPPGANLPSASPSAPGPPRPGVYTINKPFHSDDNLVITLESIEIMTDKLKVNVVYKSVGDRPVDLECSGLEDLKKEFISIGQSETVYADDSFCASNPSLTSPDLQVGETKRFWAIFPNVLTNSMQPFAVRWHPDDWGRGVEGIVLGPR